MPRIATPLSDTKIRTAKPSSKDYKLSDGEGLHLLVTTKGSKLWRMQYRFEGKQKTLSFGKYPYISLADARKLREVAKRQLLKGVDPMVDKVLEAPENDKAKLFRIVAEEWLEKQFPVWSVRHAQTTKLRLFNDVFPHIGRIPIDGIKPADVLAVMRLIEERGAIVKAHKIKIIIGQICRYAVVTGRAEYDPTASIRSSEVLTKHKVRHLGAITDPKEFGALLRAIDGFSGTFTVRSALLLSPLVFVRPGELRQMEWTEVDLDAGIWAISAEKMKMRHDHVVPLSRQAKEILLGMLPVTGHLQYVFPGLSPRRPMSMNAITGALRRLGYDGETMTAHGFRASARTMLDEVLRVRVDLIEHQLAHTVRDALGRAYNRTSFLDDRREMMQAWSDYLDGLKGKV